MLPNGGPLTALLLPPLQELGRSDPLADATMIYCAISARQRELLWLTVEPDVATVEHAIRFCLASIARPASSGTSDR
jgi:hypothetical protein